MVELFEAARDQARREREVLAELPLRERLSREIERGPEPPKVAAKAKALEDARALVDEREALRRRRERRGVG
ncbi:MAG: hypothetical protein CSA65_08360 [Proteobacteria bacterium]|nr:MAG: hypothetical protein CSA65_08360 [Pseudomonadota bacterium]